MSASRLGDLDAVRAACRPEGRMKLVNHWATWCDGCVEEIPALVALAARFGDRADFVGVGWELFSSAHLPEGALREVEAVSAMEGVTWPTVVFTGEPEDLFTGLDLPEPYIPQTFLISAEGAILFRHTGPVGAIEIEELSGLLKG